MLLGGVLLIALFRGDEVAAPGDVGGDGGESGPPPAEIGGSTLDAGLPPPPAPPLIQVQLVQQDDRGR